MASELNLDDYTGPFLKKVGNKVLSPKINE